MIGLRFPPRPVGFFDAFFEPFEVFRVFSMR